VSASDHDSVPPGAAQFQNTRWSIVLAAGRNDSARAREPLETLCRTYWPPVYAFVRRQGHSSHDAQDLTQEFFARLLEKNYLADVERERGKFRSFLLAALKHFLANEWDKAQAQKRGGGQVFIPIDAPFDETDAGHEPADHLSADKIFERRWAFTLLEQVLSRMREEFSREGKTELFEHLKGTLTGERSSLPYAAIAVQVGMSEGAVKVAVHRLRQRYREVLRAEIANTVASPAEIEGEVGHLFVVLGG